MKIKCSRMLWPMFGMFMAAWAWRNACRMCDSAHVRKQIGGDLHEWENEGGNAVGVQTVTPRPNDNLRS